MSVIPPTLEILKKACEKWGYSWQLLDERTSGLVEISKNGKSYFATSNNLIGAYPLNDHNISGLVRDKAWTYTVLKNKGYKIPKGEYFFIRDANESLKEPGGEFEKAVNYAKDLGFPVFVKPNSLSGGILAKKIEDETNLRNHLIEIRKFDFIAVIQEYLSLPEYRIFVVDGEVKFAYQKSGPLAANGHIIEYHDNVSKDTAAWVKKLCGILQIRVCGPDIFSEKSINDPSGFTIIEINNNPSLEGIYKFGKTENVMEIWKEILEKYFEF